MRSTHRVIPELLTVGSNNKEASTGKGAAYKAPLPPLGLLLALS